MRVILTYKAFCTSTNHTRGRGWTIEADPFGPVAAIADGSRQTSRHDMNIKRRARSFRAF